MTNLVHFRDPGSIRQEASLWLVRVDEGLSDEERGELATWLAADARHAKEFIRLAAVWDDLDSLSELSEMFPLDRYGSRRARRLSLNVVAASAVAVSLAVLGWYFVTTSLAPPIPDAISVSLPERANFNVPGGSDNAGFSRRSYETAVGEQLSVRLPDGSVATLNTDTLLDVSYSDSERVVVIRRGEASFNVTRDPARPFRAFAGTTVVQALGTIFNVQLHSSSRIEVTVSEGSVRVTSADRLVQSSPVRTEDATNTPAASVDMTVAAGELAVIAADEEGVRPIDSLEIEAKLAWQQGMLIFRGSPLEEALADVSRYTTIRFTIVDESIRTKRVGGYFRAGDIDALLLALRESFDIETRRVGDEIFLTARR